MLGRLREVQRRALRSQLASLVALVDATGVIRGERRRELDEMRQLFGELRVALEASMTREDHQLFPLVERFATDEGSRASVDAADEQIALLSAEHETIRTHLRSLRRRTDRYYLPSDGCRYQPCYRALAGFDDDVSRYLDDARDALLPVVEAVAHRRVLSGKPSVDDPSTGAGRLVAVRDTIAGSCQLGR
jgi:iron-sulfur cluster repair protein YtfE (RIC family)